MPISRIVSPYVASLSLHYNVTFHTDSHGSDPQDIRQLVEDNSAEHVSYSTAERTAVHADRTSICDSGIREKYILKPERLIF